MSFRISPGARQYFTNLEKHSKTGSFPFKWDYYYLCFMVGAQHGELGDESGEEFAGEFISAYRKQKHEIIGMLITAELHRQGIDVASEREVGEVMNRLIDPESVTHLSALGHKAMNQYATGGYELVAEAIPDPRDLASFLSRFHTLYCVAPA